MFNQKDIIVQNIKILNNKDISIISHNDEDYIFGPLTVEGGAVFKKGIAIGIQQKMIPGLLMYDNENFFGYSEKYGLSLLSTHPEYLELELPENIFEKNVIQPTQKNEPENIQNIEHKSLNIDLQVADTNNFYITIPPNYIHSKYIITFNITYNFDLNSIISNLSLVIINESDKNAFIKINNKCFFEKDYNNNIDKKTINKINLEIINNNYFLISKKIYSKD